MSFKIKFITESNRIEGLFHEPTDKEIAEYDRFMALAEVTVDDLKKFVKVYQPNAKLRTKRGMDVSVGGIYPPPQGGPKIKKDLEEILETANVFRWHGVWAHKVHHRYESLHPFMDGNGRSGRILWLWMMGEEKAHRGFLHEWYYQSLQFGRVR